MPTNIQTLDVADLRLDPQNPRLPEHLQGAEDPSLLRYLWDNAALDELVQSFADNGFFEHEPLIGVRDGHHGVVVLEGNRRLAALKVLLGEPAAKDQSITPTLESPLPPGRRQELARVPVYLVADRDEVHKYLGFRHIGGIKTWSAEAKARYLMIEADRAHAGASPNPFLEVARRVGSNSQGVRNSYTAIGVLRHAQTEFGLDVKEVLERRFGVWTRCMTAADVRRYVGLDGARSYEEVREDIRDLEEPPLREVLGDLSTRGKRAPLLRDSRQVTVYGQVLLNEAARRVLRKHEDLEIARQIVELEELPLRVEDLTRRVVIAREEAERASFSDELDEAAHGLFRASRALRSTIADLREDER